MLRAGYISVRRCGIWLKRPASSKDHTSCSGCSWAWLSGVGSCIGQTAAKSSAHRMDARNHALEGITLKNCSSVTP